jgi:molybdopterin synthase catalytic subunit
MKLNLRLFATLKERAGTSKLEIELPDSANVETLLSVLAAQAPALAPSLKTVLVAVNNDYAFLDQVLSPNDEIALFPPVSGG